MLSGKEVEVEKLEWLRGRTSSTMSTVSGSFAAVGWCSDPKAFAGITVYYPTVFNVGTPL